MTVRKFYTKRDPEFIAPGSPEWSRIITPSKVAAILGEPGDPVSRYESPFRLWHRMKGITPAEAHKEIFDIGHDIELYAAMRWRRKNPGWLLSAGEVQVHVDPSVFGFPAVATLDRRAVRGSSRRVVQVKTARRLEDLEEWGDPDLSGDCPQDYAAQVRAEMLFTGFTELDGHLFVVGPYFQERQYEIDHSAVFDAWMVDKCRRFYASLADDTPPPLDETEATYRCVRELHPDIDGSTVEVNPAIATEFLATKQAVKDAADAERAAKTKILAAMGNAKYAVVKAGDTGIDVAERRSGKSVSLWAAKTTPEEIKELTHV